MREGQQRVVLRVDGGVEGEHELVLALKLEAGRRCHQPSEQRHVLRLGRRVQSGVGGVHHDAVDDARVDEEQLVAEVGVELRLRLTQRRTEVLLELRLEQHLGPGVVGQRQRIYEDDSAVTEWMKLLMRLKVPNTK